MIIKGTSAISTRQSNASEAPGGLLSLQILSGRASGTSAPIDGRLRVGKADDNDVILPDDTVSRHHCELERRPEGVLVRDLDSTNGTRLSGSKIREAVAPPGSLLKFGDVEAVIRGDVRTLDVEASERTRFGGAIGESLVMRRVFGVLERIAPTDGTILLEGETGTGKDVLARAVHAQSARKDDPFVIVDCGAISYNLIESELFGHERGAFTGAVAMRKGAFEHAAGGTLFLDEVGELPLDVQPKLLRVLESREFRRVGGNKTLRAEARVIAATKRNLRREVEQGKFREDLYFRLAVVPLTIAPLRQRREDIPSIVRLLLGISSESDPARPPLTISDATLAALAAHDWPGNVRELRNVLDRGIYLARSADECEVRLVTFAGASERAGDPFHFEAGKSYRETRARFEAEFERRYLKWLLGRHHDNVSKAAREVQMDRKHLHELAKKHGLRGKEEEEP